MSYHEARRVVNEKDVHCIFVINIWIEVKKYRIAGIEIFINYNNIIE